MHVYVARSIEVKREVGIHLFTVVSCFLKRMLRYPSYDTKVSHFSHFYSIHSELRLATYKSSFPDHALSPLTQ